MRKLLSIALAGILVASLSSCSFVDQVRTERDEYELTHAAMNRFIDAVNAGDAAAVKAEFSGAAIHDDPELDAEIARLLELFPDGIWSWRQSGGISSSGSSDGTGKSSYDTHAAYDLVLDSPTPVFVTFDLFIYNTIDIDGVGIYAMSVVTGDGHASSDSAPGLFVSDSPPIIGGRP